MFDRVKDSSATTGTGTYMLDSVAAAGYRSFYSVSPGVSILVPYLAKMGDIWEVGYGTYDGGNPGTLERTVFIASSTGSPISWTGGSKEITLAPLASSMPGSGIRHNFDGLAPPTSSDNLSAGYQPGSLWRYGEHLYLCFNSSINFALWNEITSPWRRIDIFFGAACLENDYADPAPRDGFAESLYDWDGLPGLATRASLEVPTGLVTTDATPTATYLSVYNGAAVITGTVIATRNDTGNYESKAWEFKAVVRKNSTTISLIGTPTVTVLAADTSLAAASITVSVDIGFGGVLAINLTGIAATNISWGAQCRILEKLETPV